MAVPYRRNKPVRLREMFSSDYKLITILPSYTSTTFWDNIEAYIDDMIFFRYKDILIDPERYLSVLDSWWISITLELEDIWTAMRKSYNPINNYKMKEYEAQGYLEGEKLSAAKQYGQNRTAATIPQTRTERYSTTYDQATTGRLESYNISSAENTPLLETKPAQVSVSEQLPDAQGRQGSELSEKYNGSVEILTPEGADWTVDHGEQRAMIREGNIGVTTSQQMLESEISLRMTYNFCDVICRLFVSQMTLGVYDLGEGHYYEHNII